jgi:hypothetical protein
VRARIEHVETARGSSPPIEQRRAVRRARESRAGTAPRLFERGSRSVALRVQRRAGRSAVRCVTRASATPRRDRAAPDLRVLARGDPHRLGRA